MLITITPMRKTNTIIVILFFIISMTANAQKLPAKQQGSVRAPANFKIDGKTPELGNQFQAYNNSIEAYYTIANNADNLYLTVQATNADIINKIISGGITFTIKNNNKGSTVTPVAITYPLLPAKGRLGIITKLKANEALTDDNLIALNKQIADNVKEIGITGIKEIADSTISVYNNQGIKAMGLINGKKAFTCKLVLSLKYLQQIIDSTNTFNYNIKLNGMALKSMTIMVNGAPANASSPQVLNLINGMSGQGNSTMQNLISPTDLSGTYTLEK